MRIKLFSLLLSQNSKKGYILIDLMLSLIITFTLITMISRSFNIIYPTWEKLSHKTSMFDVGHYIMEILDKNLSYDAQHITITKDAKNVDKLVCQTIKGDLTYTFYCDKQHIYKTIGKNGSSGTNPLYVSDCKITGWQLSRVSEKELLVEITLQQNTNEAKISRVFNCLNGKVEAYAS